MKEPLVMTLDTTVFCDGEKFSDAYSSMTEERKQKIDALLTEGDKRLSLGAGVLFGQGLKKLGIADGSLRYGDHKKPYLASCDNLFFSLSHAGVMSVCAFFEKEIGIDIEKVREVPSDVMQRVTTKAEYNHLSSLDEEKKIMEFTRLWTVKESYVKYLGTGLSFSPKTIEMTFDDKITLTHSGKTADVIFEEHTIDGYKLTVCYGK